MQYSQFWQAVDGVLGEVKGRSLAFDIVLSPWQKTAVEAIADGVEPQIVWDSLRQELDIPDEFAFPHRRMGKKRRRSK